MDRQPLIDAIDAAEVWVGCKNGRKHVLRFLSVPSRDLVGHQLDIRIMLLQSVDETVGALIADDDTGRRIEDRDLALSAHGLAERIGDVHRAVIVVHLTAACGSVATMFSVMTLNAGAFRLGDRGRECHAIDGL